MQRDADGTGHGVEFEARLTEFGLPVAPSSVSLVLDRPAWSRGELWSSLGSPDDRVRASPDYAGDSIRDRLASAVEHDPRFRERFGEKLDVTVDDTSDVPILRAIVPALSNEGSYQFRFVALVECGGLVLGASARMRSR